jgi:hypothetical protein
MEPRARVAVVVVIAVSAGCPAPPAERLQNPVERPRPVEPEVRVEAAPQPAWAAWTWELSVIEDAAWHRDRTAEAVKAAEAIGDSKDRGVEAALARAVEVSYARVEAPVRRAIVLALAKHDGPEIVDALNRVLRFSLDAPPDAETLLQAGAAINALGRAADPGPRTRALLLEALYRVPQLVMQVRRALVADGRGLVDEMRQVLAGTHAAVNKLVATYELDRHCPSGKAAACLPVGARDFYAAVVLGDLHDRAATPDLVAALARPAAPAYYTADDRSPNTQHHAIFDALRRLADPAAAPDVAAIWKDRAGPAEQRALAVGAYAFLAPDAAEVKAIGALATARGADRTLALAAVTAVGRLADDASAMAFFRRVLKAHRAAYAAAKKRAEGPAKTAMEAADAALAAARTEAAAAKRGTDDAALTRSVDAYARATAKRDAAHGAWWKHELARREAFVHVREAVLGAARLDVVLRCAHEGAAPRTCYTATLATAADPLAAGKAVAERLVDAGHVPAADLRGWESIDLIDLGTAPIERAMIELGKLGPTAIEQLPDLLAAATIENRLAHQAVLWALPLVAAPPCPDCATQLDVALRTLAGRVPASELAYETELLRNYFRWAGTP